MPSGAAIQINLPNSGLDSRINSVAVQLLRQIPTSSLSGNNLIFADYINTHAPQDVFYFIPAAYNGTLAEALESAAPTRNAFSFYTASSNLFYFTTSLSTKLRQQHLVQSRARRVYTAQNSRAARPSQDARSAEVLLTSLSAASQETEACAAYEEMLCEEKQPYSVWFEAIGALAYQKAQSQTPAFDPGSAGAILAFDGKVSENGRLGLGLAYLYTHIHEKKHAGKANINQEDLFVYATWDNGEFYLDGCVLGGLFQTRQERNIRIPSFNFESSSHPDGWQLLPHAEVGYNYNLWKCARSLEIGFNPFVMVDWANTWQESYKEKGSGPFNAGQKEHYASLLRTEAGIRFYETLFYDNANLIFEEMVGYINIQTYGAGKVHAFLVGSPGAFTVTTLKGAQNLGVGQFTVAWAPHCSNYPTTSLFYQGEFGEKYQSHQAGLDFAWNF